MGLFLNYYFCIVYFSSFSLNGPISFLLFFCLFLIEYSIFGFSFIHSDACLSFFSLFFCFVCINCFSVSHILLSILFLLVFFSFCLLYFFLVQFQYIFHLAFPIGMLLLLLLLHMFLHGISFINLIVCFQSN